MTRSKQERESTINSGTDANLGSTELKKAAVPRVDVVEKQAGAASPAVQNEDADVDSRAAELREAIERMHERDRERVAAGEISAQDLHFIPAEMARTSVVVWTEAAVRRFRR